MGFLRSIKAAFLNRWNLLAFLGSLGFAALLPATDVTIPLILAGECAFLGFLGTNPKFMRYVEAQEAAAAREQGSVSPDALARRLLDSLPKHLVRRFEDLRTRCRDLRQLAAQLRDPHDTHAPQPFEEIQLAGLDKLLWIYLRLLFTHYSLDRFLQETDADSIRGDLNKLQKQLAGLSQEESTSQRDRMRKAIEDNLDTSRARLANFEKAQDNFELVQLEIDRLENKIRAISEMSVNRHEPEFISGQVDHVASSMVQTERTMSELQFLTGLDSTEENIPQMLQRETN
jgi:hypothetical protein